MKIFLIIFCFLFFVSSSLSYDYDALGFPMKKLGRINAFKTSPGEYFKVSGKYFIVIP
jgi:hypothetical protein